MPLSRLVARHSPMLSRSYGGRVCGAVACVWPVLNRLLSVPCLGHKNRTRGAAQGPSKPRNPRQMSQPVPPARLDLVRRESGGYPVRTVGYDPLAVPPDSPSPSPAPTSRRMVEPLTSRAPVPRHPSLTHPRHAHTRQTRRSALKRKEKIRRRRPVGETPRLCNTPERGCHRRSCA